MAVDTSPAASSLPFRDWKRATDALRAAEARLAPHAELVRRSDDVIRTRNMLTADWLDAGLALSDALVHQFAADAELLRQSDDTIHSDL
jgi:hypothetical protein